MERVVISLPARLLDAVDASARRFDQNRSAVIRQALQEWIERQEEFQSLLAEGYQALVAEAPTLDSGVIAAQACATEETWRWDE
jgi:metal-responsive CopG/Arc/MetJ family transcriptional regulator